MQLTLGGIVVDTHGRSVPLLELEVGPPVGGGLAGIAGEAHAGSTDLYDATSRILLLIAIGAGLGHNRGLPRRRPGHGDVHHAIGIEGLGGDIELRLGAPHQIELIALLVEQLQFHAFEFHHRGRLHLAEALRAHRDPRAVAIALRVDPVAGPSVYPGFERPWSRRHIACESLLTLDIGLEDEPDNREKCGKNQPPAETHSMNGCLNVRISSASAGTYKTDATKPPQVYSKARSGRPSDRSKCFR